MRALRAATGNGFCLYIGNDDIVQKRARIYAALFQLVHKAVPLGLVELVDLQTGGKVPFGPMLHAI